MANKLPRMCNRPHVSNTSWIATILRKRSTWHFDAWLVEDVDHVLWFRIETSEGGIRGLSMVWARVTQTVTDDGYALELVTDHTAWPDASTCQMRRLSNVRLMPTRGYDTAILNLTHWRTIYPRIKRPAGYKWQSVALHYIAAPSLDPLEGAENWHSYTIPEGQTLRAAPPRPVTKGERVQAPLFRDDDRPLAHLSDLL